MTATSVTVAPPPMSVLERQPLSRITEAELLARVGRPLRIENCACGGQIAAVIGDWVDIGEAVRTHVGSFAHRDWARGMGYIE